MKPDIRLAFDSLQARAESTDGDTPPDRISLRDHVVDVDIGAFQSERGALQRVRFNVVVEVKPTHALLHDDVDRILSYDMITDAIDAELAAERLNLLETLAERIAERILVADQAERVFVRIEKLDRGPGALGVEIVRTRSETHSAGPEAEIAEMPHPIVAYLSNTAIQSDHLKSWLDQLQDQNAAVILCVGSPDGENPASRVAMAQKRIDLLAVEQNAWVLAGRDKRCVVMRSRTELDWAARHGKMAVWAPSKIVLDSHNAPADAPASMPQLIDWFCEIVTASKLVMIGPAPDFTFSTETVACGEDAEALF